MEKNAKIVPFFYKEQKRKQRLFRSFIKNEKERKAHSVLLKRTDAQPNPANYCENKKANLVCNTLYISSKLGNSRMDVILYIPLLSPLNIYQIPKLKCIKSNLQFSEPEI